MYSVSLNKHVRIWICICISWSYKWSSVFWCPEDTRYITRITLNKTRSTGSVDKGLDSQLQTQKRAGSSVPEGSWEGVKSLARSTTYHMTVDGRETPVQEFLFYLRSYITDLLMHCLLTFSPKCHYIRIFSKQVFRECQILQGPHLYVYKWI